MTTPPTTPLLLGCIADDVTGATDLANMLVRAGMRVVQVIGVPEGAPPAADAVVVALKSRTAPVEEAVGDSLAAARWLRGHGAGQLYFKVCSTFDSTPQGNIGPVAEALAAEVGARVVPVTPAFPENGRTVYKGHLFVGDVLLSESPMRDHPLTPMTDANLVRVLGAQLREASVGLVDARVVGRGAAAIAARLDELAGAGERFAIVDATADDDLRELALAARDLPLVVAGSGLAIGIPALHGLVPSAVATALPPASGAAAVISGSCSAQTNVQVARFRAGGGEAFAIEPRAGSADALAAEAIAWARGRLGEVPVLVYATAPPDDVRDAQRALGAAEAGARVEAALGQVAAALVEAGVGRLVVAGGETAGAVVAALGIRELRIGSQIDPGVPWCHAAERGIHIALKSGNFGGDGFLVRAFEVLA